VDIGGLFGEGVLGSNIRRTIISKDIFDVAQGLLVFKGGVQEHPLDLKQEIENLFNCFYNLLGNQVCVPYAKRKGKIDPPDNDFVRGGGVYGGLFTAAALSW